VNVALDAGVWTGLKRWAPILIKATALAWAAWVLAGLAWLASGHDGAPLPAPVAHAQAQAHATIDTARLATLDLFGVPAATAGSGNGQDAAINGPETTLQLKLNGVFVSGEPQTSSAIVSEASQPTGGKLYVINDSLPGGATLASVYEDRIVIRRSDGNSEILHFEKTPLTGMNSPPPPGGQDVGANVRAMLDQASAGMAQSPDAYVQSLGLVRDRSGYVVGPNAPDNIVKSAGLKPGDRIVSINGQKLGDPVHDRALLTAVKNQGSASVEIQRGEQTLTINQKF
jgi:general secretion pathway protein C